MAKGQNIGYIRVSSIDQNTDRQLDGIELDKIFTDKCSGKDIERPQLKLLIDFVREDDTIFVHSMDRLARNLDDLRKLVNTLTTKGVIIKFMKENLVFTGEASPMSTLLLSVMGAFAEFERSLIRERQKEGIAIAKKAGKYGKRGKRLTLEQIQELKQMAAERYKKIDIARKFGISRDSVYRYLKSTL
jgi:DNA invertase Pin-like site-specific DNA recombinase